MGRAEGDEAIADRPAAKPGKSRGAERTASREVRRHQLIEATIAEIAEKGLSGLTVSDVARRADLATGMVNFHFTSKAQLLDATLDYLTEEYRACWREALDAAGQPPAQRLRALVMADLDPAVCTRQRIAVWHAFYGEARARPAVLARCAQREAEHHGELRALCEALIARHGPPPGGLTAADAAAGINALTDGLWLGFLFSSGRLDRAPGRAVIDGFLAALFPAALGGG